MSVSAEHQDARLRVTIKRTIRLFKIGGSSFSRDLYASLNLSDVSAIAMLGEHGGGIMREVAEELDSALSTATAVVDRLVRKGLVVRSRDEGNRRIVRVALSPTGNQFYASMVREELDNCRKILSVLSEEERESYLMMMEKVADALARGDVAPSQAT